MTHPNTNAFTRVTWLIRMCKRTHSYVWQESFKYVRWLIRMGHDSSKHDMTDSYVTWLIHMWHDSLLCDMTAACVCDMPHPFPRNVTNSCLAWRRSHNQICSWKSLESRILFSDISVLGIYSSNFKVNPVIPWNRFNPIQRIFPSNSRHFFTLQPRALFLSRFFVKESLLMFVRHIVD